MKELTPLQNTAFKVGGVLLIVGAALYVASPVAACVIFAAGALLFSCMQMLQRYDGSRFTLRRLRRQQLLAAVAILIAACLMAMQTFRFGFARRNEWVVALTIGCVLELYTAFRIPAELKREGEGR